MNIMSKKLIIGLTIAVAIGIGTYAFGHMGGGYGNYDRMHGGPGMHQGYYGEQDYDDRADLKNEDIRALEEERSAFLKATDGIRQNLYSKELELRNELYKENPDVSKAAALQKEISELESELDQKRIDHMIKIRKISPDASRGFAAMDPMMGYGSQYPGTCWQ
jgi:Spy/CpxP family protein refolding chaperone